jgi:hypothetical protein
VARCENSACGHTVISYNSCRNRHCPKCQGAAARKWLAERETELLPVGYFHVVYTLPARLRDIAYHNKRVVYDHLMKAAAETTLTIAADPKRLGAKIGFTAVLHTWGSALTHHPHVHMIVPGGGLSEDASRWISSRPRFLARVEVFSRLFRGRMLAMLVNAHAEGRLHFYGDHAALADRQTFKRFLAPLRRIEWVVYCKEPFAGPSQLLRYLSRTTHRVAISKPLCVPISRSGQRPWRPRAHRQRLRSHQITIAAAAPACPNPATSCLGASPTPPVGVRVAVVPVAASEKPAHLQKSKPCIKLAAPQRTFSLIVSTRFISGSASAVRLCARYSPARLLSKVPTSGWSGPSAFSWAASARR